MWTISQLSGTFSAIFRQASYDGVRFQASFDHFRSVNWAEDCVSVKTREIKIHVYDNGKRESVPRDQVFPLIVDKCSLLQLQNK